ncbi:hypothetical protein AAUPMB_17252 [Pasteurella multocida subsp. multocida str. Anand1_buffalo]|nr:hypothetical protein AAUPMB_17252 [Pasteurella multocida subsp. multocida str. Anand1_buffalo]
MDIVVPAFLNDEINDRIPHQEFVDYLRHDIDIHDNVAFGVIVLFLILILSVI